MRHAGTWEKSFRNAEKMDGVGLADSVETFGVDLRSEKLRSNVEGDEVLHGQKEPWCSDWRWFDNSSFLQEERWLSQRVRLGCELFPLVEL